MFTGTRVSTSRNVNAHLMFCGYMAYFSKHSVTMSARCASALESVALLRRSRWFMRGNGDGSYVRPETPTPHSRSYGSIANGLLLVLSMILTLLNSDNNYYYNCIPKCPECQSFCWRPAHGSRKSGAPGFFRGRGV
jgi:hypothetical protein